MFTKLSGVFSGKALESEELDRLEEVLLSSDLGFKTTESLIGKVKQKCSDSSSFSESDFKELLRSELEDILGSNQLASPASSSASEVLGFKADSKKPYVIFVVGVNGAGKTTTIGKLSSRLKEEGHSVLLGACDTFRAAAGDQLSMWAERSGVKIEKAKVKSSEESSSDSFSDSTEKPATVAFRAVKRAIEENFDVLIVDTAGRLHTKHNLMKELGSVKDLISRELPGAPHEVLLVLDASSGQNALQQAKEFNQLLDINGLTITKLDGTAKGGILVAIKNELKEVPIRFVGVGEGVEDLQNFNSKEFIAGLLDAEIGEVQEEIKIEPKASEHGKQRVRRRRRAQ